MGLKQAVVTSGIVEFQRIDDEDKTSLYICS